MSKKSTTLYLDKDLVKEAKKLGFNLSRTVEIALERRVKAEKSRLENGHSEENSKERLSKNYSTTIAGVAKSGQRRSVEGAVP